jgi:putative methyltransferase
MLSVQFLTRGFLTDEDQLLFLNPVQWYLQLRHHLHSESRLQYNWLDPVLYFRDPAHAVDLVSSSKPDVLCISVYAWNRNDIYEAARVYKNINPECLIIAGGADIDAHKNSAYFQQYPFVDFAVYGDGEEIFSNILDHIAGHTVEFYNVVVNELGNTKVHPHRVFRDKELMSRSPYLEFRDQIARVSTNLRRDYPGYKQCMVWETVKGCPYRCSYCDWSAGLHNKVRSWHSNTVSELEMFSDLGFEYVEWTNPNYGLMREDIDIAKSWAQLRDENRHVPRCFSWNFAKLDKTQSIKIFDLFVKAGIIDFLKFDLQDADNDVLVMNQRPEQPMDELLPLMRSVTKQYPELLDHRRSRINYILALPGQTIDHFHRNIDIAVELGLRPNHFALQLVPNSPAFDPFFRRTHGLQTKNLVTMTQQFASAFVPGQTAKNIINLDTVINTRYLTTHEWTYCMLVDLYLKRTWTHETRWTVRNNITTHQDYFWQLAKDICLANQDPHYFIFGKPEGSQWKEIDFKEIYEFQISTDVK